MPKPKTQKPQDSTAEKLLKAAAKEFNEHGFSGTDTNRIARRAQFAPQTFYRWFTDKVDIFIKAYDRWRQEEFDTLSVLLAENAGEARLARAVVAHHEAHRVFRRSLRQLSAENDLVRAARAESRLKQVAFIKNLSPLRDEAWIAAKLLQTERLADALAEGEFKDMGLSSSAGEKALAALIRELIEDPAKAHSRA